MKASEYADLFKKEGRTISSLMKILYMMIEEVVDIGKKRKAQKNESFFSILDEIDLKCQSFVHKAETLEDGSNIKKEVFRVAILTTMPEIFRPWNEKHGGRLLPPQRS
jgi:hypothetical protein